MCNKTADVTLNTKIVYFVEFASYIRVLKIKLKVNTLRGVKNVLYPVSFERLLYI